MPGWFPALGTALHVQRPAIGGQHRFVHGLRQRGMGKYGFDQLGFGGFERLRNGVPMHQFGDFRAYQMRTQQLTGSGTEDRLDEAGGLAYGHGLAIALQREL